VGGLRIDHILGLFRLWWIPRGKPASQGTYVYYDHEAMISILAEEAQRAGSVIVGEDIGGVMPWTRAYLESRGIGGNSIIWFEPRHADGSIADPQDYRAECLSMTTSHDLPPTASYLNGQQIDLRVRYGLLTVPEPDARAEAAAERSEMVNYLVNHGFLAESDSGDVQQIVFGLYRFLKATPSRLKAVSLVDMVGETRSQNLPGTFREYPNWRIPLADAAGHPVYVEDLSDNPLLNRFATLMNE
jgi:4-alpha-glucanotransferase